MYALFLALTLCATAGPKFIEDDYAKALKQAKAQKKLLFVDAWAPWCHSCIAMKEQVFPRPAFAAFEREVVFASIDTEKSKNAAFLAKFPVEVWPTLLFIEPQKETVVLKWLGSVDENQMRGLLESVRKGPRALREADEALGAGGSEAAAQKYRAALTDTEGKTRTVLSMLSALSLSGKPEACAKESIEQLPLFTSAQERVSALTWGLNCALDMAEGEQKRATLSTLASEGAKALSLSGVLPDDTSGLYEMLVAERALAQDDASAQQLGAQWLSFLETEAAKATTPASRAVFDAHRVAAALVSKQAEKMVEPLLRSEKELPSDYNPPARLALVYRELGKLNEGLHAVQRALGKCKEGPRKLRLFEIKASLQEKKGDDAGRTRTLKAALTYARALPRSQVSEKRIAALEAQLSRK